MIRRHLARFAAAALLASMGCRANPAPQAISPPPAEGESSRPPRSGASAASPGQKITFTAAGDIGIDGEAEVTLKGMGAQNPAFHLILGDLSYAGRGSEPKWCEMVKANIGGAPVQLVAGNHEDDKGGDGFIADFARCLPDRMGSTGLYGVEYFFDVGALARVIMVSPTLTVNGRRYSYGRGSENQKFLQKAIAEGRAAGMRWIIAGMHKPCISMGTYQCEIGQEILSLLIAEKVDLVLAGHDHTYQRTHQIGMGDRCPVVEVNKYNPACVSDNGGDNLYGKGKGTVFVVAGAGGAQLYDVHPDDYDAGYIPKYMGKNKEPRKGFFRAELAENELRGDFVGATAGSNFSDNFRISGEG